MRSSIVFFVLFSIILSVTFAAPVLDIPIVERTVDRDLTISKTIPVLDQDRVVRSDVIVDKTVLDGNFAVLEPITRTDVLKRSEILKDDRFVEKSSIVTPITTDVVEPTIVRDNLFVEKSDLVEPVITKEPVFVEKKKIVTPVSSGVTTSSILKDDLFVERVVQPIVTKEPFFVERSDVVQPLATKEPVFVEKRDVFTPITAGVRSGVTTSSLLRDNFFVERSDFLEPVITKEPLVVEKRDIVTPITTGITTSDILGDNLFVERSDIVRPIVYKQPLVVGKTDVVEPVVEKSVIGTPIRTGISNRFITLGGVQPTFDVATKGIFKRPVVVERVGSTVGTNIFSGSRILRRIP